MNRRHRLAHSEEFQRVRRQGRSWSHSLLVLLALRNDLAYSRFGFVTSRRIGKAVVRNRARRLMREAARVRLGQVTSGWDIVLVARAPMAQADFWRVGEALDSLLRRAELSSGLCPAPEARTPSPQHGRDSASRGSGAGA